MPPASERELIVRGPTYFSPGDEKAFFDWLHSISCVEQVQGQVRDLHVKLKRPASKSDLTELAALLKRYKMSAAGLSSLKTARNADWFAERSAR
jgi:hypothetical protein